MIKQLERETPYMFIGIIIHSYFMLFDWQNANLMGCEHSQHIPLRMVWCWAVEIEFQSRCWAIE